MIPRVFAVLMFVGYVQISYGQTAAATLFQMQIPQVNLVNQDGMPVRFDSDVIGNRLAVINTVFTTCTTVCPVAGANFGFLARKLGDRLGRDVILVSISIDPMNDTPDRLKIWSAKFYEGGGWTLLTGKKPEVDSLLKALGLFSPERQDHTSTVLIGNYKAGWTRANSLASPNKLLQTIEEFDAAGQISTGKNQCSTAKDSGINRHKNPN